jgi:hypothetical protein
MTYETDPAAGRDETPLTLAECIDIRLRVAGFTYDDPALAYIRHANELAAQRSHTRPPSTRPARQNMRAVGLNQ